MIQTQAEVTKIQLNSNFFSSFSWLMFPKATPLNSTCTVTLHFHQLHPHVGKTPPSCAAYEENNLNDEGLSTWVLRAWDDTARDASDTGQGLQQ